MKNPWIAAVLNFFLMGAGTLYNGRRVVVGAVLTVGAAMLTFVELHLGGNLSVIPADAPGLFPIMFVAVFLINTVLAYDGYVEAQAINQGKM